MDNAQLNEIKEKINKANASFIHLLDAIDKLTAELEHTKRERDMAVEDMKHIIRLTTPLGYSPCGKCARINSGCSSKCTHDDYVDFEWRGAGRGGE